MVGTEGRKEEAAGWFSTVQGRDQQSKGKREKTGQLEVSVKATIMTKNEGSNIADEQWKTESGCAERAHTCAGRAHTCAGVHKCS